METRMIDGTAQQFKTELESLSRDGWKVTHFNTTWVDAQYCIDQYMMFSAILTKEV